MTRALVCVLAVVACGGGRAEPRGPVGNRPGPSIDAGIDAGPDPAVLTGIADGLVETLATMAAITHDAADCPAMATDLGHLFDRATPLFALAQQQAADPEAARMLTAAMDARAAEVAPLVERIEQGLARCQHDPAVAAAMARMPTF